MSSIAKTRALSPVVHGQTADAMPRTSSVPGEAARAKLAISDDAAEQVRRIAGRYGDASAQTKQEPPSNLISLRSPRPRVALPGGEARSIAAASEQDLVAGFRGNTAQLLQRKDVLQLRPVREVPVERAPPGNAPPEGLEAGSAADLPRILAEQLKRRESLEKTLSLLKPQIAKLEYKERIQAKLERA